VSEPGLDLDLDEGQHAIADAVAQLCRQTCPEDALRAAGGAFTRERWRALAGLGLLAAAAPGEESGALEAVAALEALGRHAFPGPLPETFLAGQVLPEPERRALQEGALLVTAGAGPLLPVAAEADAILQVEGNEVRRTTVRSVEALAVLDGEPWGRAELEAGEALPGADRALALFDLASAAYLAALARRLLEAAADHARTRVQFGRAIGEFQAVAHPLADCAIRLEAASTLARAAAGAFDASDAAPRREAAVAHRSAARAAVETVHVAHQVFGAVGITLEGPAFHWSRRLRQRASLAGEGVRSALLAGLEPGPGGADR